MLIPDRYDLLRTLEKAATQNFEWGLDLADALAELEKWDTDLWPHLMGAWTRELDVAKHREVLDRLNTPALHSKQAQSVADVLRGLVKQGGLPYAPKLLDEANEIAVAVWECLDRNESSSEVRDWLGKAINHAAGNITEFWLESLSLWGKQQTPRPDTLGDEYHAALLKIVRDSTLVGTLGKTILARHLRFIMAVDENWTRQHLIPSFENTDDEDYCAVWHGFVYGGPVSPQMAEALEDAFLNAVPHLETVFPNEGNLREAFIGFYSLMVAYFVEAPLDSWIPDFFQKASIEDRHHFAWSMSSHIGDINETLQREWWERWLKSYWKDRLQGVPKPLVAQEIVDMFGWLPKLIGIYPEAVDLAVGMEPVSLENSSIIQQINDSELWQKHPQATAKLLIHLGHSPPPGWVWDDGKELVDRLLGTDLPQDLKTELKELVVRLDLN